MAAAAPAEGGRRPSYQYYNNQESTLLPEVPLLTGADNFRLWEVAVLAHLRHYNLDESNSEGRSTPRWTREGTLCVSWDEMQKRIKVYQIIRRSIAEVQHFLEKECRSNPWISLSNPTYDAMGLYELVKEVFTRPPPLDPHQSQDQLMIDLMMLKAANFGSLSEYLDGFYALWSRLDVAGLKLTDDLLLNFLLSGLDGHYDKAWTDDLEVQRLMKKIDLHEALKLIGERVCEEGMYVMPLVVPPKDAKYRRSTRSSAPSSTSTEHGRERKMFDMDLPVKGYVGQDDETIEADIRRRQEEMAALAAHSEDRTLHWAVDHAFDTSWSLDGLDPARPVSSEYDIITENGRSTDGGGSRSASPADKKERRRGYKRLSDLVARCSPLPLSVTSSPRASTIRTSMDALRIDDNKSQRNDSPEPGYVYVPSPTPPPNNESDSAARKESRRRFLAKFVGTPIKSAARVMSYQDGWKPKPLFSSPRKFSWEDGVSNSEHDYESVMMMPRTTPEPPKHEHQHQREARRELPPTPVTGDESEKQQDEDQPLLQKRLSAFSPEKVAQKKATAIRNFSRPKRPLIRTASL